MKRIITISREFGAGGSTIGEAVAKRLGYEYYDKAVILSAAKQTYIDVPTFQKMEERVPGHLGLAQTLFDFYNRPLNDALFEAQRKIVRQYGDKGGCVIVGRNASSILREYDNSLHVFITAQLYWRIQNLKKAMPEESEARIADRIRDVDKMRRKYCAYYTNTEFGNASYYDLCLSASALGIDTCIDLICELAQK